MAEPDQLDCHAVARLTGRLSSRQVLELVQQGWCRYTNSSGQTRCVVTDARSEGLCRRAGHTPHSRTSRQYVIDAVLDQDGPQLSQLAANMLPDRRPDLSARDMLSIRQIVVSAMVMIAAVACLIAWPDIVKTSVMMGFAILFTGVSAIRVLAVATARHGRPMHPVAPSLDDADLPVYTVLVPLFGEANILPQIFGSLRSLNYPRDKLDVKIIVEANDKPTAAAARRMAQEAGFDLVTVSPGKPQTKPRALNLALMFARGELVTIYDAEDIPQPMQLRLAAQCFASAPSDLACLQARLSYYNSNENWLTRQFTIEYASLFDVILPALARWRLPLPLGGTSNHFRIGPLKRAGGWDAWNVTEDADLGLRLARLGYRAEVLGSTTFEEANCDTRNWMQQRARWLKGWMQTWIVIMRHPLVAWRNMGTAGFVNAQIMMAGMIGSALLHPLFLVALVSDLFFGKASPAGIADQIQHAVALAVFVLGYGAAMAVGVVALRLRRLHRLMPSIATMPAYWLLISAGGWLALWQLVRAPFHWNKTAHGISRMTGRRKSGGPFR